MTLPHCLIGFYKRRGFDNPRIVHQNSRTAIKLLVDSFERTLDAFRVSNVTFNSERFDLELFADFVRHFFDLVARTGGDRNVGAFTRERKGDGASDAASAAGDHS